MLEYLFGSPVIEKILFYLLINEKAYALELKKVFDLPIYSFQRALAKLEQGGVLMSTLEGKTRIYQFNPRYIFLKELQALLQKSYLFFPEEIRLKYYDPIVRRRPRRQGKPL